MDVKKNKKSIVIIGMNNTHISKERNIEESVVRKIRMCVNLSLRTKRCFLCSFKSEDTDEMLKHIIDEKNVGRIQSFIYETTDKHIDKDIIKLIISDVLIS